MTDLREMEKYDPQISCLEILKLHKRIETRINEQASTTHFGRFGLNGEIYEWLTKETVLRIIEEEFGRLDNV